MVQSVNTEKKNTDVRLQYILSLIVGFSFLYLCGFAGRFLAARWIGPDAAVSITVATHFLNAATIPFVAIGIVFALVLYRQAGRKSAAANIAAMIVFLGLQGLLILIFLIFGRQIGSLYIEAPEIRVMLIPALRTAAIPMVLLSAASAVAGIAVKKKSFLLILMIDLAAFVLSLIIMFISTYILHWGVIGIAIGLGIMQPAASLLPNVGGWRHGEAVPASADIQSGEHGGNHAATQMFCPKCGARFSAEKKYCDQCGTELSVLLRPDADMRHLSNSGAQDAPSTGFAVLGFFIPLVGLILFLVWHDTYPLRAKSAGKGALVRVITNVILSVLLVVIQLVFLTSLF